MHDHTYTEVASLDGSGFERVCDCGIVQPSEIDVIDKVSGCMDLESYMKVVYGPPTNPALQNFLLPTLVKIRCRDKFVDAKILAKLRIYTAILRISEQRGIPREYADEAMRRLLKSGHGIHSKYEHIKHLIDVLNEEPKLQNRIPPLKEMLMSGGRRFFKTEEECTGKKRRSGSRRKQSKRSGDKSR